MHAAFGSVSAKSPENHTDHDDNLSGITDKYFCFTYHSDGHILPAWRAVSWQFKDEKTFFRGMNKFLRYIRNNERWNDAHEIKSHHHKTLAVKKAPDFMIGNYQSNQHGIHRQAGAATHQRSNEYCKQSFF